jgi:hypothetical protein
MRRLLMASLPLFLVSACGGGGGSIPLDDLTNRVIASSCAAQVRCKETPSLQACADSLNTRVDQLKADVAAGKTRYDGAAAADCLNAVASIGCTLSAALAAAEPESCIKTFQGTILDGQPCFEGEECVSQTCEKMACDVSVQCCAGKCAQTSVPVAPGGDCSTVGTCPSDQFCLRNQLNGAGTCTKRAALGEQCASVDDCVRGLWCHVTTPGPGVGGTCAKLPAVGEACDAQNFPCDSVAATCNGSSNKCVARADPGANCVLDQDCVIYASCDPATLKCLAKGSKGATCATESDCLGSLTCDTGRCVVPPADPVCS